ncbi:MAG: 4Fe-4S dicluster domain-containing protein [Candidatus Omnitrophica bacterium]|jgi:hydrogenase-4 component H|nr:4Fe-4S dicluster domain-containing protein [Candidatus Omnitrophota bacterium]
MKKPKLRELNEAIKSLFSRPHTTRFPREPLNMPEGFRGKPQFYEDGCVGCGACAQVCPAKAIEVEENLDPANPTRNLTHIPAYCINCQECERNCITGQGIKLTKQFDVSYFSEEEVNHSIQHQLVLCSHCGSVIGTKKHILWVINRVGSLSFAQANYIEFIQKSLKIQAIIPEKQNKEEKIEREEIFNLICPKCRRAVYLEDEKIHF